MSKLIGQVLGGRYEVIDLIGEGGMAEVYRARHLQLERYVAIKVMYEYFAREKNFAERFKQEARLVAQLQHPNIIQVYDFEALDSERLFYMVIEYINGQSLASRLNELAICGERLPLDEVLYISHSLARALSYAHARGMIHRDIKPGNVLLDVGQPDSYRVVLTDFGIARMVAVEGQVQFTSTSQMLGTPAYIAPEQALGQKSNPRSDLYSLGVMMYQMVIGQTPFSADTPAAMLMRHINDQVEVPQIDNLQVPPGIMNIIMRLLAKDPADRYQSADELAIDLQQPDHVPVPAMSLAPPRKNTANTINLHSNTIPYSKTSHHEVFNSTNGATNGTQRSNHTQVSTPTEKINRPLFSSGMFAGMFMGGIVVLLILGAFFAGRNPVAFGLVTETPTPTWTHTASATPTNSPIPTLTLTPSTTLLPCVAVAKANRTIRLLSGPGSNHLATNILLEAGSSVPVIGVVRDAPDRLTKIWWQLQIGSQNGWAPDTALTISGDCENVPLTEILVPVTRKATSSKSTSAPTSASSGNTGGGGNNGGGGGGGGTVRTPTNRPPTNPPPSIEPTNPPPTAPPIIVTNEPAPPVSNVGDGETRP